MRRQVVYSARWYNTPPLGPAVDFVRSGGFRSNQLEAPGWLALHGLGGVIGLAIHLLASVDLLASLAGGVGLVWTGAIIADRFHGRRLRDGSRAG